MLDSAICLAVKAHKNQKDLSGKPYILHALSVITRLKTESTDCLIAAVLHDVLEDSDITVLELIDRGFSSKATMAIVLLTRGPKQEYFDYIRALANNGIAKKVKIEDLHDNKDRCDTALKKELPKDLRKKFERLSKKYEKALQILEPK